MNDNTRLQELGDFLRTRRARLSPNEVGLPNYGRRRTPGLRREEVAYLANIGISWYTSLEQGRDVQPSEQVLAGLASALRLSADERRHLFMLARQPVPVNPPVEEQASLAMTQMVHTLDPNPAYVLGRRWDLLVWNRAADAVFRFSDPMPPHSCNLLWRFFNNPTLTDDHPDGEHATRGLLAHFRAASARYPDDPWFAELINDLQQASALFRRLWSEHDVLSRPNCHKEINHPSLGLLEFEMMTLQEEGDTNVQVMVYMASPETTATLLQEIDR